MWDGSIGDEIALKEPHGMDEFNFTIGDVVLAEWEDKLFYAKIQKIDRVSGKCTLIFDDDSVEECPFAKIHSVTETTAEIVCIICKDGTSLRPNEIVLCDKCGIGYHQLCHDPAIPAEALEFDAPWMCVYCSIGAFCPYLENPFESKPTRKGVRKTRIHTLKSGESCLSSGNSTEDEKDIPRDTNKSSDVSSRDMSSFYFSSHMHQRDASKPRGRPAFGHKSKSTADKRVRGTGKLSSRPGVRDRDQHSERNSEIDVNQQRKGSHHYHRHGSEISRHPGRYSSPVQRLGDDSEGKKLSPARDSRKYQQTDENKAAKVVSHRRDAPREKQRLTQDLARQKRLLSEDIARAELLQREQLSKKFTDMFDNRKESLGVDRAFVDVDDENISKDNFHAELRRDRENNCSPSMYETCYGDYSPEYSNDHTKKPSIHEEDADIDCKLPVERESLFDRFLRKGPVEEIKNIEFVNESKVEVKGMRYKNNSLVDGCSEGVRSETDGVIDVRPELEPLKFENVTDDELTFSDGDREANVLENCQLSANELKANGGSPTFPKAFSPVKNGTDSSSEAKCNGLLETCDLVDSPMKNDVYSEENSITNMEYESCECPSEDGIPNCDDKTTKNVERCNGEGLEPDHSSIKSSKIARLMEEPDMQCEHSSKHGDDCESQDNHVFSCEMKGESSNDQKLNGAQPVDASEKQCIPKEDKSKLASGIDLERADMRDIRSSELQEKETSHFAEQNSENVANESELSNIEGMSDAGELSEPEVVSLVSRSKVKKKKRRKQESSKSVHQSGLTNVRRKTKGSKGRLPVKDAKATKRVKQLHSESDDDTLRNKSQAAADGKGLLKLVDNQTTPEPYELMASKVSSPPSHSTADKQKNSRVTGADDQAETSEDRRSPSPNEEQFCADSAEEVVAQGTVGSDNCDNSQEANTLSSAQRTAVEEDEKREQVKREKKIGKTKRKSEEKEKERDRSTPPHLISQHRYARDLPRHNWLVERLLQQKKLCAEDTLQHPRDAKDEQGKEENPADDEHELSQPDDKENPLGTLCKSLIEHTTEKSEASDSLSPKQHSDHEDPGSPPREGIQNELHRSFLRRSFPPNVPKTLPRLTPSAADSSGSTESKPPPPPLKHGLSSKEPCGLEPLPKLRKIVDDKEIANETQENEESKSEPPESSQPGSRELEQPRKVMSPIEILDDEDEKKKRGQEDATTTDNASPANDEHSSSTFNETSQKDGERSPVKSLSASPPNKHTPFTSSKKPFGTVNPTVPSSIKDKFGRPMHVPPHRAAILIPVAPMHDGTGIPISPGLSPASPHMKGYSPRTFTPHLLTHSAAVPGPGMFGNPLSQGGRYSATNCGHHMHGNMKPGMPCKRDVNCPFHGNNPRGLPPGILDIPGHHGPIHGFGPHSHDHMSAVLSRERRESDKGSCQSPPGRDALGDKQSLQTPKVVKPIAHVPGKRPPLMLSHLQQIGKQPASLRELEALHEEKARRFGADILLSPHHLQKSPERSPREQVVPNMSPLHERRPLHQPLTLSDLNRRREEEMMKVKAEEGLKSSSLPSPSRGPAKLTTPPHPKDPNLLSPGRGHRSTSMSPVEKREQVLSLRRLVEDREPGAIMSEFLKPGPPRLRPLDEAEVRVSSEPHRREEILLSRGHTSPFLRVQSAKDVGVQPGKVSEGVEIVGPRGIELLGQAGRVERERDTEGEVRPKSSHGNSGIVNPGLRLLEDKRKQGEEGRKAGSRGEQRGRERASPEMEHRHRVEQTGEHKTRSRSLELVEIKEKDPRIELRDKDGVRIAVSERERSNDLLRLRVGEGSSRSRLPLELSPPLRHKMYADRAFLPTGAPGRIDPRVDPRMIALHELEMHRRGEAIRASEPSHRELLSRMASSLPISKGGSPIGKSLFVRPDGSLERRGPDSSRVSSEGHVYSPPTSLSSREYGLMMNSRQAMERLAAAAGKPGSLLAEVSKDIPPHIRQDIERERERERQRLSLEQIEANRRLLHAELKDKVNPLVFSKEHQLRMEQKREHIDALRAREKRLADRERLLFMERISEERKRRFSELEGHGGILMRHSSPPQFGHFADRDEYERVKRLKLSEPSVSLPGSVQHSKLLGSIALHSERKDRQIPSPKDHVMNPSHVRDKASEAADARINRPKESEHVRNTANSAIFERDSIWHRNREQVPRAPGVVDHKRSRLHPGASIHGYLPPKVGPLISQREESKGSGKPDGDGVNRCSVCKRDASFLCSGCQAAWYCSTECQLSAWGTHNRECSQNKRQ